MQAAADSVVDLIACPADLGGIEQMESEVACDVTDDRVAGLCGDDQPFEHLADVRRRLRCGVGEPVIEQCRDDRDLILDALQREEDAVDRFFELGCTSLGGVGVVVTKRARKLAAERFRQSLNVGIE